MCGVAGFWNRGGIPADESVLSAMLDRQHHRGPDDRGAWTHGSLGLGLTRLSILDLSPMAHQPFVTEDHQGVISYNGEVYNFRELRRELEEEGVRFRSGSDTEVVLYALHRWGVARAVPRFNGMFAFAYFDHRSRTLWLARDRTGIKPLYLAHRGSTVVFASEAKTLFAHPAVPCRADLHSLTTQAIHGRLTGGWTPFEGVEEMVPGTMVEIAQTGETTHTWFDLLRDLDVGRIIEAGRVPFDQQVTEFQRHFARSVELHLLSDAPLATMCSGGLDSSLVAAVARDINPGIVAYVADAEGYRISEADKAERVCRHLGIELRRVPMGRSDYLRLWAKAAFHNDQPIFFPSNPLALGVNQAASADGFKVLLNGEGSDELFGGYRWAVAASRMWRQRRLHARLVPNVRPLRILGRLLGRLVPPDLERLANEPFQPSEGMPSSPAAPEYLVAIDGAQRHVRAQALWQKLEPITPLEDRAFLAREFEDIYCHLATLLPSNDKMGMAASLESRVPFLESNLIDFGLHLDLRSKFHDGQTKRIVKAAAAGRLPEDIIHAPKIGFGVPNALWSCARPMLRGGMVAELFKWGPREEEAIYRSFEGGNSQVFRLLSMELWARLYLGGETEAAVTDRLLQYA